MAKIRYANFFIVIASLLSLNTDIMSQTIGTFNSVQPTAQGQTLILPATHTFQRLIKSGDPLSLGGNLGNDLDFTGYVPIGGSSTSGYLSISSESTPAQVAILNMSFNPISALWVVNSGGKVGFNPNDIGDVARFCSGTVTPNNTIIVSEENLASGQSNPAVDTYEDRGWLIEIDPATRTVINQAGGNPVADKLWALGRDERENAVIKSDNTILYTGTDNSTAGFLYKFVPTVPGVFSSGSLYVLRTTSALGTGTWKLLNNTTVAERHSIRTQAQAAPAAYNFNGVEDVEIGPDGRVYFTAKGTGSIYRFTDDGATVSGLMVFAGNVPPIPAGNVSYDVDGAGPFGAEAWGTGNDNLAFDGEGNLWVLQDGSRNHIWVISPTHTQAIPQVRLFGKTPSSSEPTGITFTPNYRYMFISIQHPNASGSQSDAAGNSVTFASTQHATLVVARTEFLGPLSTLPLTLLSFDAKLQGKEAVISWSAKDISNHDFFAVERSVNGTDFEEIYRNNDPVNGSDTRSFTYTDNSLPNVSIVYYRLKQCDLNGKCRYTEIKTVKPSIQSHIGKIFPQPANNLLNVQFFASESGISSFRVADVSGKIVLEENRKVVKGEQTLPINTSVLKSGMYLLTITDKYGQSVTQIFSKQ